MTEIDARSAESGGDHGMRSATFVRRQLPFLAILALAIAGVAYTNMSRQPLVGYWEFLAVTTGIACVLTKWAELDDREARLRLMWTQALHWVAVLVAMNIVLMSGVQQFLPALGTGVVLLILLALGALLAGINLLSLQISFLGGALMLAVPAISWVKHSALFLILAAVGLAGVVLAFWPRGSETHALKSEQRRSPTPMASDSATEKDPDAND